MAAEDKALIASSEFDSTAFVKGVDDMTAALTRLNVAETAIKKQLTDSTAALDANNKALQQNQAQIAALDKTSANYNDELSKLTTQQQTLNKQHQDLQTSVKGTKQELAQVTASAANYKGALAQINDIAGKVKQSGKTLFDVAGLQQQVQKIGEVAGNFRDIFKGKVSTEELDALEEKLAATGDEFERLREVIAFVQEKMSTLDPNTQEFQDLAEIVKTGTDVLDQFADVEEKVEKRGPSLRAKLSQVKDEMGKLIANGEAGTDTFKALEQEAAHLQDAIDKTGERVRTFASDTRLLEGGIEAIRGIAAGFELAEGFSALFGVKNEAVEESIKRLNAIMAIANGLQEVSNLLKKESTLRLVGEEIATKAYTISQRILAATLGTTAAASKGLAAALAATGIGLLVVGIGLLLSAMQSWSEATKKQTEAQENLNVAIEQGNKDNLLFIAGIEDAGKVLNAEAQVRQANNQKVRQSDIEALKQRQANAEESRQIGERTITQQIEQAKRFEESQEAARDRAQARLDEIVATREASAGELEAFQKTVEAVDKATDTRIELEDKLQLTQLSNARDRANDRFELQKLELQRTEDFLKRLDELRKRLLDAQNRQGRQDAAQLAKTAQDNLNAELKNIDREVRQGRLTRDQGNVLKNLLKKINGVELETELREFGKKVINAQQSIEDEIFNLRLQSGQQRAELLRDQLEREARNIELGFREETNKLEVARREQLEGIRDAFDQGLISEGQAKANTDRIILIYQQLFDNLTELTRRKQEQLARLTFERSQELVNQLFAPSFVNLSEKATVEIQKLTAQFLSGRIRYDRYQRELTEITRRESKARIDLQITENQELLRGLRARLAAEQDPKEVEALNARILALREQIAQLKRQAAAGEADQDHANTELFKQKVTRIAAYAQAIGQVVAQVVSFWQMANEAEQRSLDRSIQLQEERVAAATRIAERGNTEYLRLEEDRLNELRVKQENAARRQLAINAVLQASQALVAFTSALAQGISTGGPLGGIAIAAAVLGLLASGYAIVQSLQQKAPQQFFKGTTRVQRKHGEPAGRDTIPALLTENEAVLPTDVNADYADVVDAMFHRRVPPTELNQFVNNYPVNQRVPALNYQRIGEAAEQHVTYDGRLLEIGQRQANQMEEVRGELKQVNRNLKTMGVSFTLDRNGMVVMLLKGLNQSKIDKRT